MFALRENNRSDESWSHFIDLDPAAVRLSA
jgi:hypothetical protein